MARESNTLTIIGLVIGLISLVLSLIPCLGSFGLFGAIPALILSIVGFLQVRGDGGSTSVPIIAIVVSSLAILLSGAQAFFITKATSTIGTELDAATSKTYTTCDSVLIGYEELLERMRTDRKDGLISKAIKMGANIGSLETNFENLLCQEDSLFVVRKDSLEALIQQAFDDN